MKKLLVSGGETHIGEVTKYIGDLLDLKGVCVREKYYNEHFAAMNSGEDKFFNYPDVKALFNSVKADVAAVANENDLKYVTIKEALNAGLDVIADKPLAITIKEQESLEEMISKNPQRDIIMLLTLRGEPEYMKLKELVEEDAIGETAFVHVKMAVQMKRHMRPDWFLDHRRSGGLFLDLLIHGIDAAEWATGRKIVKMAASTGNIGHRDDEYIKDHASVYVVFDNGATGIIEGQRLMPGAKGSDYRMLVTGTKGTAELDYIDKKIMLTDDKRAKAVLETGKRLSIVENWCKGKYIINTADSLRANRLAVIAGIAALEGRMVDVW